MKKKTRNKRADYTLLEELAADLKKTFLFLLVVGFAVLFCFAMLSSVLNGF